MICMHSEGACSLQRMFVNPCLPGVQTSGSRLTTRLLALYKSKTCMFRHIFAVFVPQVQIESESQTSEQCKEGE